MGEQVAGAVDLAAHDGGGPGGAGGHDQTVAATGHRVEPEQHATHGGRQLGLDEDGHRCPDPCAGLGAGEGDHAAGGQDGIEGHPEAVVGGHVEHRREHAGHRAAGVVLDGRRRPHHDRPVAAVGDDRPRHAQVGLDVALAPVTGEGAGGHHHAGQHRKSCGCGPGQRRRLGPRGVGVGCDRVVEGDHRPGPHDLPVSRFDRVDRHARPSMPPVRSADVHLYVEGTLAERHSVTISAGSKPWSHAC